MANTSTSINTTQLPSEKGRYGHLRWPMNYDSYSGNGVVISEYEYFRVSTAAENFVPKAVGNSVYLPVPQNLETMYSADWDTMELGALGAMTSTAIGGTIKNLSDNGLNQAFTDYAEKLRSATTGGSNITNLGKRVGAAIMLDSASLLGGDRVMNQLGIARNPFVSSAFRTMQFRTFDFNYLMIAESFEESQAIHNIISCMKLGMHPDYTETFENMLFKYPSLYKIEFTHPDYLFNIGFCTLNQLSVNYHSQGTPVYFHKDNMKLPASIQLSLRFTEIEVNTRKSILEKGR